jgi:pseudoazurin
MKRLLTTATAIVALSAGSAMAEEHVVQMLNEGPDGNRMVFEPAVVMAEPGDTVRFVPTDKGHNAQTVDDVLPEGVEGFRGGINQEVTYTVPEDGTYLIRCTPHYGLGMVALIVVGDDVSNADAILEERMPRRAEDRVATYIETARERADS